MPFNGDLAFLLRKGGKENEENFIDIIVFSIVFDFNTTVCCLTSTGLCGGDHGGTCATRTLISVPSETPGIGETVHDRDYFRFTAPVSGKIFIYTTGAADTSGFFGSSCDLWLTRDVGLWGNMSLSWDVRAGIHYYVAVEAYPYEKPNYVLHVKYANGWGMPEITSPAPGTTLSGSTVTFHWSANAHLVDAWLLFVETSPGASDISISDWFTTNTSETVSGLPTDGSTVYVRLVYHPPNVPLPFPYVDAQYTAYYSGGCTLSPGHLDYCSDPACGPCAAGEGDCDYTSECQSGLTCAQVPGTDTCQ